MFNFDNVKKLFGYDWGTLVPKLVPKGNKTKISDASYKNIFNGAILMLIAVVVYYTAVAIMTDKILLGFGSDYVIKYWLKYVIGGSIVPAAILIYNKAMKDKEQVSWVFFIMLILTVVSILSLVSDIIGSFDFFGYSFGYSIYFIVFGLARIGLTLLGCVHLAVGCIDFCYESTSAFTPQTVGNYQPAAPVAQPTTPTPPTEPVAPAEAPAPVAEPAPTAPDTTPKQ